MSSMIQKVSGCALLAAPLLLIGAGCGGGSESTALANTAPRTVMVKVAAVERRPVERTIEVVGSLKGWEEVSVGAKKGGRVVRVLHDMGDHVLPGEKLVELDTTDAKLALYQAKSKYLADLVRLGITQQQAEDALEKFGITEELLVGETTTRLIENSPAVRQATVAVEKSKNNLTRLRHLAQRGAATLEELQNTENDFKGAEAARDNAITTARNIIATAITSNVAIRVAERSLIDLTINAPEPSRKPDDSTTSELRYGIVKRSVSEGQVLKDGDVVMELVVENTLRLWTNVPEHYSAQVEPGQPVRVTVASFPGDVFEGKVARINPSVDPATRTFQVEVWLSNHRGLLRPGGFAKASIVIDKRSEATVVPLESIVEFAGVTKVFVVDGNEARAVNVKKGLEGRGWVEVVGAVPVDGRVVVEGQSQLAEGTRVEIRAPEEEPVMAAAPAPKDKSSN